MKALFLLNPAAGHGRSVKRWQDIIARLRAGHKDTEVWHTRAQGDGAALTKRGLEQGFEAVIGVGGDGTIGEVVHGYLASPRELQTRACVGTWPAGSGCDTARHLGLSVDDGVDRLLAMLADRDVRRLDAGRVFYTGADGKPGERYFINIAALGLAGDVARRIETTGKRFGGTASYFISSVGALLGARAAKLELTVDGVRQSARYHLVTLANSSSFGGGMRIADGADMQDGLLDMVTVGDVSRWTLLRNLPKIYRGEHLGTPGVARRTARRVEASSDQDVWLNIDGEALGKLPAVIEVVPGAVPFLCPKRR